MTTHASRLAAVLLAAWALVGVISTHQSQGRGRWQHPDPRTLARFPGP